MKKKDFDTIEPDYRYYFSCFLICVIFATLFAVRLHIDTLTGKSLTIFSHTDGLFGDWFLYCKSILFIIWAAIILLYFIGEKLFPDKPCRFNPILTKQARIPLTVMGIYAAAVIASAIFSPNKDVVLKGMCSEYEGVFSVLSYCVIFLAGYNYFCGSNVRKFYKKAIFVLITVTVILSAFEYTVMPLLELPFMKYIIAPAEYRSAAESLAVSDTFRESVLMFYNSNYMGGFCTMIFPLSVYYAVASEKLLSKILCGIVCAGSFAAVIMSNSTAALYIVLAEALFLVIFIAAKKLIKLKSLLLILTAALFIAGGISLATGNEFARNIIKSFTNASPNEELPNSFKLDSISISGNSIHFSGNGSEYTITAPVNAGEVLTVTGGEGTMFSQNMSDSNTIQVLDMNSGVNFSVTEIGGIIYLDLGYMSTIDFAVTSSGIKLIVQNTMLLDEIPVSEFNNTKLADFYGFATGRGYIWLNTLPILKKCIIIGKGPGNFPFLFTQNEITGLANTNGSYRIIVDKPHSWYLQIAVTCGIPAMLAILFLFGYFVIFGMKLFVKTTSEQFKKNKDRLFLLCLFTGLGGFMVIGLANDSSVTVNPFFWFNLGIALCRISDERKELVK